MVDIRRLIGVLPALILVLDCREVCRPQQATDGVGIHGSEISVYLYFGTRRHHTPAGRLSV